MKKRRLAILDLYDNTPNQGMRCIKEIADRFADEMEYEIFDVRGKAEVPDLSYDIYISSGGPGSPLDGDGHWDKKFHNFLGELWQWNANPMNTGKFLFLICHSFQMACHYFEVAEVTKRKSISFGTFPVHQTEEGLKDSLLGELPDPFYAADFRTWQVVQPKQEVIERRNAKILALEKIRPDVPLERAIMAIRFSDEIIGVQFHPEADPEGMLAHFQEPERSKSIIEEHGQEKYQRLLEDLEDPNKIALTHERVLPEFLNRAINLLQEEVVIY